MLKTAPINLRALEAQKNLIDQAAALLGKTRSEFILEASCSAAENTLMDKTVFSLTADEYRQFIHLLEQPTEPNDGFEKLMSMTPVWER
ncbi:MULTISPECIES: DUF1778 domain-containing protein [unclassified Neisseria]|uniref:type II toxin-antitoxin system TacA family antitoxin n=1 Tax=unclassified Neisseria TaxID=2623750 RepID=UPI001072D359|nr:MULTISPECIES: DUF1778 domain-containing protein [unclassified Neisseria]MBF0803302.1 DUF1778 domain-containing protein [Neisseria sp. 19428wB4_WF04]TFU43973.1 DUF1778 domain-containing protein [Neisseria sp. WF04]